MSSFISTASVFLPLIWIHLCSQLLPLYPPSSCQRKLSEKQIWTCPPQFKMLVVSHGLLDSPNPLTWYTKLGPTCPRLPAPCTHPGCFHSPSSSYKSAFAYDAFLLEVFGAHVLIFPPQCSFLFLVVPASHKSSAFLLSLSMFQMGGSMPFSPASSQTRLFSFSFSEI